MSVVLQSPLINPITNAICTTHYPLMRQVTQFLLAKTILSVVIIEPYQSYQLHTKCNSTFFCQA
jgi:hypothetical protein